MAHAELSGCKIILPEDCVAVKEIRADGDFIITNTHSIPDDYRAIDIGPQSIAVMTAILENCKTLLWNGPMGVFEIKPFDKGTNELALRAAYLTKTGKLRSVAGGGDTVSALENAQVIHDFTYVSSAGGAFLEWLQGDILPGVAALSIKNKAA